MQRREFLVGSGQAVAFAFSARAGRSRPLSRDQESPRAEDPVEQRVSAIVRAYDAQGNHRTGTEVDTLSAEWLAAEVRRLGRHPPEFRDALANQSSTELLCPRANLRP